MKTSRLNAAFSLFELIIVITVLSIMIVVTLSSKKILSDGKIKLLAKEAANIKNLTDNFVSLYNQLPGDFNKAGFYWSTVATNCTDSSAPSGCNGNNDGVIDTYDESYRFWQHLYLSGLMTQEFSGEAASGTEATDPLSTLDNSFKSKFSEGALFTAGSIYEANKFEPAYGNRLYLDKVVYGYFRSNEGILLPQEALAFDNKFDDAKPRTGNINAETYYNLANNQVAPYCTVLGSAGSAVYSTRIADTYNVTVAQRVCRLIFRF